MKYEIEETQIKNLINYLQNKPFIEVYQGIEMLSKLKKVEEEVVVKKK